MTAGALKELLACLPDDCLALELEIELSGKIGPCRMVLIDPPNNWHDKRPRIVLTNDPTEADLPGIIARVLPRHS